MTRAANTYFGSRITSSTGDSSRRVTKAWSVMEPSLRRTAERMTPECDEQDDLLQEALIQLWICDPTRFDLRNADDRFYLKRVLVNRMWQARSSCLRVTAW